MGWWPFKRKVVDTQDQKDRLHIKGTRVWLQELQEACELNFDSPEEGKRIIRYLQVEWKKAAAEGNLDEELRQGLERRAFYLLKSDATEWSSLLDDLEFWRPGWRSDR